MFAAFCRTSSENYFHANPISQSGVYRLDVSRHRAARRGATQQAQPGRLSPTRPRRAPASRKYVRKRAREGAQLRGPFAERPERARGSFPSPPSVSPFNRPCARTEALAATPVRATAHRRPQNGADAFPRRRGAGGRGVSSTAGPPRRGAASSSPPTGGAGALTARRERPSRKNEEGDGAGRDGARRGGGERVGRGRLVLRRGEARQRCFARRMDHSEPSVPFGGLFSRAAAAALHLY